jgi:hypothetical protein
MVFFEKKLPLTYLAAIKQVASKHRSNVRRCVEKEITPQTAMRGGSAGRGYFAPA